MSNPNPPINSNRPPRHIVERIAREEAEAAKIDVGSVLGMSRDGRAVAARHKAWRRIMRMTRCSIEGLAHVWGCYAGAISSALAPKPEPAPATYDPRTIERLRWRYGDARTAQIIAGNDPRTKSDLAKWRALGSGRSSAA